MGLKKLNDYLIIRRIPRLKPTKWSILNRKTMPLREFLKLPLRQR